MLTNCELSRFGKFLHVKGGRRHAEPYRAQVFWTMLCWPCMTMPWSLPQELIVHRPFWQYQFSCNFSMCPWRWAKNIQHLVQQSGLTTDSVYPDKSQWYYQYSKEKRLPDIYCTGNSRCIQTKSTGANRVSCSSSVELADDDVRMIPSASPSKLSKTICSDFFDPPHIYIIYIYIALSRSKGQQENITTKLRYIHWCLPIISHPL